MGGKLIRGSVLCANGALNHRGFASCEIPPQGWLLPRKKSDYSRMVGQPSLRDYGRILLDTTRIRTSHSPS